MMGTRYSWDDVNPPPCAQVFLDGTAIGNVLTCHTGKSGWLVCVQHDNNGRVALNQEGDGILSRRMFGNVVVLFNDGTYDNGQDETERGIH